MRWTPDRVELVRDILAAAPTRMRGYRLAAEAVGTTETAVRCLVQRITPEVATVRRAQVSEHDSDDLADHRRRVQVSELQAAKKRLLKELADREEAKSPR